MSAGWRPINTAPMDGNPILLWWRTGTKPRTGRYAIEDDKEGFCCDGDQCIPQNQKDCTHWMPLPEPPTREDA